MFKVSKNAIALSVTYFTSVASVSIVNFEQVSVSFEYKCGQISAGIKLERKFCFDEIYNLMTIYILGRFHKKSSTDHIS